jgi:hypothetical protein
MLRLTRTLASTPAACVASILVQCVGQNTFFPQVPGSACLRLPDCGHFYCTACLRSSAAAQVELGALENIRCPEPGCRRPLAPYVVKELLGEAGYAR